MKESLYLYRILIIAFLSICIILTYMNITIMRNEYLIKSSSIKTDNINEIVIKEYGYTDILSLLKKDVNIDILNINSKTENIDFITIDMKYNSTLDEFNNTLEKLKSEPCFVSVENIKIDKTKNDIPNINFTAVFLKNK